MVGNQWWEGNIDLKLPKMSFLEPHPLWQMELGSWDSIGLVSLSNAEST